MFAGSHFIEPSWLTFSYFVQGYIFRVLATRQFVRYLNLPAFAVAYLVLQVSEFGEGLLLPNRRPSESQKGDFGLKVGN
jgi:hypothetical protein